MAKIVVLGAGLVGRAMAIDLAKSFDVTAVDLSEEALANLQVRGIKTIKTDLSDVNNLATLISKYDLIVGAMPGFMGLQTALTAAEVGRNMVDISFFPEDPFQLDDLARKNNVTIVTDCGVAPGMGNIILGYHNQRMKISHYECLWVACPCNVNGRMNIRPCSHPLMLLKNTFALPDMFKMVRWWFVKL
jgi:saccharopine dehydrogenase-like NADP-dependent oxidoreductase